MSFITDEEKAIFDALSPQTFPQDAQNLSLVIYNKNKAPYKPNVHVFTIGDTNLLAMLGYEVNKSLYLVNKFMTKQWDIHPKALLDYFMSHESNYVRDAKIVPMEEVMGMNHHPRDGEMRLITNARGILGAGLVFHPQIQEQLLNIYPEGAYLLPSSIHEMLSIPASYDANDMLQMVYDINHNPSVIYPEDVLDDCIYHLTPDRHIKEIGGQKFPVYQLEPDMEVF